MPGLTQSWQVLAIQSWIVKCWKLTLWQVPGLTWHGKFWQFKVKVPNARNLTIIGYARTCTVVVSSGNPKLNCQMPEIWPSLDMSGLVQLWWVLAIQSWIIKCQKSVCLTGSRTHSVMASSSYSKLKFQMPENGKLRRHSWLSICWLITCNVSNAPAWIVSSETDVVESESSIALSDCDVDE